MAALQTSAAKLTRHIFYGVKKETGTVDYDQLEATALKEKPKMIICGASAYSRDWDYKRIREVLTRLVPSFLQTLHILPV